jgi:hypothetical protein
LILYIYKIEYLKSGAIYLKLDKPNDDELGNLPPSEHKPSLDVIYEEDSALVDQSHDFTISRKHSKKDFLGSASVPFKQGKEQQKPQEGKSPLIKKASNPKPKIAETASNKRPTGEILDSTGSQQPRRTPPRRVIAPVREKSEEKPRASPSPIAQRKETLEGVKINDRNNIQAQQHTAKLRAKRDQMKQALEQTQGKEPWSLPIKPGSTHKKQTAPIPRKMEEMKKREPLVTDAVKQGSPIQSPRGNAVKESYSTLFGKSETSSAIEGSPRPKPTRPQPKPGTATEQVRAQIARERSEFLRQLNSEFLTHL